jgi:hypothetical protein
MNGRGNLRSTWSSARIKRLSVVVAVVLATSLTATTGWAVAITLPAVEMQVGPAASPMTVTAAMLEANSESVVENPDGSVSFLNGSLATANWDFTWTSLTVKTDPFIGSVFGFQNVSGVDQTYIISVSLPVIPLAPSTLMGGSTGGSVTDSNFNGLGGLSTVAPTALYTGMIDGVPLLAAELHPDPFSLSFAFAGDTVNIPAVNFGLPGPTVPGPPVAATIGIMNKFTLSSGDSIAMTNFFVVETVPEPSSFVLAGLAAAGLGWQVWRRRRRA